MGARGDREKQQLSARKPESDDCKRKKQTKKKSKKKNPHLRSSREEGTISRFP